MRPIKFRIWNGVEFCGTIGIGEKVDRNLYERWEDLQFQQFTGLKDINGKEIYEGDVVRTTDSDPVCKISVDWVDYTHGEIKWICEGFKVCQKYIGAQWLGAFSSCECCNCCLEIIGNIFENPSKNE